MTKDEKRIEAAQTFARKHDPDPQHAGQVCKLSLLLYDALSDLHQLGKSERVLLQATAIMHDVGYDVRLDNHQKGSRDLIATSKLDGFSERQLAVMACIARYHGKRKPKLDDKIYRDLPKKSQTVVDRLAAILRIADALDRSHIRSVEMLLVERHPDIVRIIALQRTSNDNDIEAAKRKGDWFEQVFNINLQIVVNR